MVSTILGILLTWFAVSVVTALVVGRLAHRRAEDWLEELLATECPDLWLAVSIALGRPVSGMPKNSPANF